MRPAARYRALPTFPQISHGKGLYLSLIHIYNHETTEEDCRISEDSHRIAEGNRNITEDSYDCGVCRCPALDEPAH